MGKLTTHPVYTHAAAAADALGVASPMPDYLPAYDRGAACRFVDECLSRFYTVSVYDGEEYTVKKSSDRAVILAAMGSTDMDRLHVYNASKERLGCVLLVWGNSPGELFADFTDNIGMEELVDYALVPWVET